MKYPHKFLTSAATAAMFVAAMPMAQAAGSTSAPFNVTVTLNSACSISTAPGDVAFGAYTAITNGVVNVSSSYGVTCTNNLPFTMALDAPGGSVAGLTYTVALSAAGGTGSGIEQTYQINGVMAGGQAGDVAAAATQGRTLTISY